MPPHRSGSCVDSVSSAIYKHLVVTRARPGESGWAVSGLCDISHNCHRDGTAAIQTDRGQKEKY